MDADVVRRRFEGGWRNFERLYRNIVDEWILYDSSQDTPRIIERGSIYEQGE